MIRKLLVLGLVIGAVAAPAALAKPVSSDTLNGGYDPWAVGLIYKSTQQSAAPVKLGPLDPWAYSLVYQSTHPSSVQAGSKSSLAPWERSFFQRNLTAPVVTTNSSSSFDYGDAGIGAAAALGVALILLGTIVMGMRYRRTNRSGLATS
jgi:hypothetical protein